MKIDKTPEEIAESLILDGAGLTGGLSKPQIAEFLFSRANGLRRTK